MSNKEIEFSDGNNQAVVNGTTLLELSQNENIPAIVGSIAGQLVDLSTPIAKDGEVVLYDVNSKPGLKVLRQTAALIMAEAIKNLYPDVIFAEYKITDENFYYDMRLEHSLSSLELGEIEQEMKKIIKEKLPIKKQVVTVAKARKAFRNNDLKLALLEGHEDQQEVSLYRLGNLVEIGEVPYGPNSGVLHYFKLLKVSGAYWQGDSNNEMLQRVAGVAFANKKELEDYAEFLAESERRNHRRLGKELELFMFSEEAPGMPFYLENGQIIRNELEQFLRQLQAKYDYKEVKTPLIMNQRLWEQSGHWDHYKDNMYFTKVDDQDYALKPMNCPGHCLIFKDRARSYRELPIRMAEFGQVHRHEFSGALNGLLRVRTFCQDDAHIFVAPNQIEQEIALALKIIDEVYKIFGFEYAVELSTRPEDYMGEIAMWDKAEASLEKVLQDLGYQYTINEGDGAFYGPKIDIHIKDALNRSHQCATVQLDFQMPEKFDLHFIDENNQEARPVMIHRAVFGSLDRFLGILIEHFAGAFPVWLAPKQVELISVAPDHEDYVEELYREFKDLGIRVSKDVRNEKLGKKIRDAQMKKVPYVLVIGDQERDSNNFSVRSYQSKDIQEMSRGEFIQMLQKQIDEKSRIY